MFQNFVVAPQSLKQPCNETLGVGTAHWECDILIIADGLSEDSDSSMSKFTQAKPSFEVLIGKKGWAVELGSRSAVLHDIHPGK